MQQRFFLEDNEKVICESESQLSASSIFVTIIFTTVGGFLIALPFIFENIDLAAAFIPGLFIFGIGFYCLIYYLKNFRPGKTAQLIITSKRVFIYDKRLRDYIAVVFKDISNWQCSRHKSSFNSDRKGIFLAKFTFKTSFHSTYIVTSVSNYPEVYKVLIKMISCEKESKNIDVNNFQNQDFHINTYSNKANSPLIKKTHKLKISRIFNTLYILFALMFVASIVYTIINGGSISTKTLLGDIDGLFILLTIISIIGFIITPIIQVISTSIKSSTIHRHETPFDNLEEHFDNILKSEFSEFNIEKNVSAQFLFSSSPEQCHPYTYILYSGGRIKAIIMLTEHNGGNTASFKNAKAACLTAGIPFINFFTHMPNEREYVVNRIRSFI